MECGKSILLINYSEKVFLGVGIPILTRISSTLEEIQKMGDKHKKDRREMCRSAYWITGQRFEIVHPETGI